jgi:hypothetical protein
MRGPFSKKELQKEIGLCTPDLGRAGPTFDRWSAGIHQALAFVMTVENELDSRRHSQLVKNFQEVVTDDRMAARGWGPRRIAFTGYAITTTFACVALWGLWREPQRFWIAAALSVGVLVTWAVALGCLRLENGSASDPLSTQETR